MVGLLCGGSVWIVPIEELKLRRVFEGVTEQINVWIVPIEELKSGYVYDSKPVPPPVWIVPIEELKYQLRRYAALLDSLGLDRTY